ncbi:MAG: FUSC family protein [Microbacteriaceae bacterium]
MTDTASSTASSTSSSLGKRILLAVLLLVSGLIPVLVLYAVTHELAMIWALPATFAGVSAVLFGDRKIAIINALTLALLAPVAISASANPVAGTALIAVLCLVVGQLSQYELQGATLFAPVLMSWLVLSPPPWDGTVDLSNTAYLAWVGVAFGLGALLPALVLPLLLKRTAVTLVHRHSSRESLSYTVTIMVLAAGSTWVLMNLEHHAKGAWVITTIIMLAQVGDVGTFGRTLSRVLGTLLGVGVVMVVFTFSPPAWLIMTLGVLFAIAAITAMFGPRYWLVVAFLTPAVLCADASSSGDLVPLGELRLEGTVIGGLLVVVAALVSIGFSKLSERRAG